MPIEKLKPTFSFNDERVRALEEVVPEAFADGRINWEALRELLADRIEDDDAGVEHFGLFWPGKRESRRLAAQPSNGTLVPVPGEGVDERKTENIFIEGDNLEVLKLLQKAYSGRIKMIYIDPPYNTGNDFIYRDDYSQPLEDYLKKTRQMSEEGELLTTNTKTEGRFHTNWLNMMYPRLFLSRNLLREDGVIFVSIDDNELHHLRPMMNEVFGEENFVNVVSVKAKPSAGASGGGEDKRLKKNVEYLLIYTRDRDSEQGGLRFIETYEETDLIEHIQTMRAEGKSWKYTRALLSSGERTFLKNIQDGSGNDIAVFKHEDYLMEPLTNLIKASSTLVSIDAAIQFAEDEAGAYMKYFDKIFRDTNAQSSIRTRVMQALPEEKGLLSIEYRPKSGKNKGELTTVYYKGEKKDQIAWLSDIAEIQNNKLIMKGKIGTLWEGFNWNNVSKEGDMQFPSGKKPIAFIMQMLSLATSSEDENIVLDFFAGSGSTAHAVLAKNKEDNGTRRFIIVQLPEPSKNPEFSTNAEICKERLRRSIASLKPQESNFVLSEEASEDYGFKSFRLDKSNFKAWQDFRGADLQELQTLFSTFETPLVDGWKEDDLLVEILLLEGFPLSSKGSAATDFSENKVIQVESDLIGHRLFICLETRVKDQTIKCLAALHQKDIFICLDSALDDAAKAHLNDVGNVRTI